MSSLVIFALAIGSLASLAACLAAATQFVKGLRRKWIEEADSERTLLDLKAQVADVIIRLQRVERKIDHNAV